MENRACISKIYIVLALFGDSPCIFRDEKSKLMVETHSKCCPGEEKHRDDSDLEKEATR